MPLAVANPDARRAHWRHALSGLTPTVLAIVAALLLVRMFSSTSDRIVQAVHDHGLGAFFLGRLQDWAYISLVNIAPIVIIVTATSNLGPQHGRQRAIALTIAVVLSSGIGTLGRAWGFDTWAGAFSMISYVWPRYALLAGLLTIAGEFYRHEMASTRATQQTEIDSAALALEMAEARLHVLQAQIEPHFLFNTLANVRRLYDVDHAGGAAMLANLMRYLEIALPRIRQNESTLGREAGLVEAYLRIQQIRMGKRLAFRVDTPVHLRACGVPPMMLLTLVENAVKHGLDPSPEGGSIRVGARSDGDRLLLNVVDTGVGFAPGSGAGTGLANIRARLAAQFGDRASLDLENNDPSGVTARIALPLASAAATR
jgi:sensor histidine kinase YesM